MRSAKLTICWVLVNNTTFMNLKSPRLKLIELTEADIIDVHNSNCHPQVARYNTIGIPKAIAETAQLLAPIFDDQVKEIRTLYGWAIRQQKDNNFIGEVGLKLGPSRFKIAELYYSLHPTYWGQGFATEAALAILHFGFIGLELHRIEAGVAVDNNASIRLLERIGMTREGRKRKVLPIAGEWVDNYHYAILEEDYL